MVTFYYRGMTEENGKLKARQCLPAFRRPAKFGGTVALSCCRRD
ncbi:hypothetical protein [Fischerella thermalis]|nr:hypothetical protein [Fischerella thermalis]